MEQGKKGFTDPTCNFINKFVPGEWDTQLNSVEQNAIIYRAISVLLTNNVVLLS